MRPITDFLYRALVQNHAASARSRSGFADPELEHPYVGARSSPPPPPGELGSSPAFSASMSRIPLLLLEWCSALSASKAFCNDVSSKGCSPRLRR